MTFLDTLGYFFSFIRVKYLINSSSSKLKLRNNLGKPSKFYEQIMVENMSTPDL